MPKDTNVELVAGKYDIKKLAEDLGYHLTEAIAKAEGVEGSAETSAEKPAETTQVVANQEVKPVPEPAKVEPKSVLTVQKDEAGNVEFSLEFQIWKQNDEQRLVGGVVYEPDTIDSQGDSASEDEIRKAAHKWMMQYRTVGIMHKEDAGPRVQVVESFIAPENMKYGNQFVKKGAWVLVTKIFDDQLWNDIKDGKLTGFSMGGSAKEEPNKR